MYQIDFSNIRVLVVGDVMLDIYYYGNVRRISPEAPVPVVKITDIVNSPGGAANTANNIVSLKAQCYLLGSAGKDEHSEILQNLLKEKAIHDKLILTDQPIITKSRIIGSHQQIARLDFEYYDDPIAPTLEKEIINQASTIIENDMIDIIIFSDYNKGLCSENVCRSIINKAKARNIKVIIDPKGHDWSKYNNCYLLTPNLAELSDVCGQRIDNIDDEIVNASKTLLDQYNIENILVTRSEKGMSLISKNIITHYHTEAIEVYDVSGAGDTVIATLATALAGNYDLDSSVKIANKAAGIAVSHLGTTPVTLYELRQALFMMKENKKVEYNFIQTLSNDLKQSGKRIVFTNGCFDILHMGHIRYLKEAKTLGDVLILGLNSDKSVKKIKGADRPVNNEDDRLDMLANLEFVDYIVIFDEDTPYNLLRLIHPHVLVKGGDYQVNDIVGREFAEEAKVIQFFKGYSSTSIINKLTE